MQRLFGDAATHLGGAQTVKTIGAIILAIVGIVFATSSIMSSSLLKPLEHQIDPVILPPMTIEGDDLTGHRRRPQAIIRDDTGTPIAMLVSLREDREDVSISTAIMWTDDAGGTWRNGGVILDRITGIWQGDRAFGTAVVRDGDRWAMFSCGNDETGATPGIRSAGLWHSDDLMIWEPHPDNPIITVDDLGDLDAGMTSPVVGLYVQHLHQISGVWYALVTIRGDHAKWSRTAIMISDEGLAGPWRPKGLAVDASTASHWWKLNDNLLLSEPMQIRGLWYAVARNGVGANDRENNRFAVAVSDDYLHWRETGWLSPPMIRHTGAPIVAAQTLIVNENTIVVSARGNWGQRAGMYLWTGDMSFNR